MPAVPMEGETVWRVKLGATEAMKAGSYPERPGEPDCSYYVRTGLCRFGMACKFNHPANRKMAAVVARLRGGYPERVGQPECKYYMKTGTCKFGATCKYHHPKEIAANIGKVQLNLLGYPLRPNEIECAYYSRTGECKFANTCKFHHPQPSNAMMRLHGSVYSSAPSPISHSRFGGVMSWPISRPFLQGPQWEASSSYPRFMIPPGLVHVPSWNTFSGPSSTHSQKRALEAARSRPSKGVLGTSPLDNAVKSAYAFPERPGEPECQFYMKTGDCKFGSVCKFHHPRDRSAPAPDCVLSPLGLPLRAGEPMCVFYARYGICKFGPICKFDHPMATPMGIYAYDLPSSSTPGIPMVRRLLSSTPITIQRPIGAGITRSKNFSSEPGTVASGDEAPKTEEPCIDSNKAQD